MKNTTVRELIEMLKTMNQNAVVCSLEMPDLNYPNDMPRYFVFTMCEEYKNIEYINDIGNVAKGDVVALY